MLGAVAIVLILGATVAAGADAGDKTASIVGGNCTVLALLLGLVSSLWPAPSGPVDDRVEMDTAARHLASRVRELSKAEQQRWGITDPEPLLVRWHVVPGTTNDSQGAERKQFTGTFSTVRGFYASIPSQRMVIQGEPGSGKTVLAHALILALCDEPDSAQRVPVLFSLSAWNPYQKGLRQWMIEQLRRDFPALDRPLSADDTFADALVRDERILPFLDGFDEIPEK